MPRKVAKNRPRSARSSASPSATTTQGTGVTRRTARAGSSTRSPCTRCPRSRAPHLFFFGSLFRRAPTANAEGETESEGGSIGKVPARRVSRYLRVDAGPPLCSETLKKKGLDPRSRAAARRGRGKKSSGDSRATTGCAASAAMARSSGHFFNFFKRPFRGTPTATAEGWTESIGSVGKVSRRGRIYSWKLFRRAPTASAEG